MRVGFPHLLLALVVLTFQAAAAPVTKWEVWDYCTLDTAQYFDGDSFHIHHGRDDVLVRLYFVDAPETDKGLGERLGEQAAYFRTTEPAILHAGGAAKELTRQFLAKPFRVITRMQPCPGASRAPRYYAIVESATQRLDALLVDAGLGRTTGEIPAYPTAAAGQQHARELRLRESKSAQARLGLWNEHAETLKEALQPRSRGEPAARLINLNTATAAELSSLPGVGEKTAAQIIRARPLKDLNALDALPGFGPKKMEALRELVSF